MMNRTTHTQHSAAKFQRRAACKDQMFTHSARVYRLFATLVAAILFAACLPTELAVLAEDSNQEWVTTWGTALHEPSPGPPGVTNTGFNDQTLRQIVHTSVGGNRVRVRLSTFGANAVVLGSAHIALRDSGVATIPGSDRTLSFGGQPSIRIPPDASVLSDPVDLEVPALSDLAVSMFLPGNTGPATWHRFALQTSYISPTGDFTGRSHACFLDDSILVLACWR
jgi:hypothetical protein